jgi:SLT domain-containing protein
VLRRMNQESGGNPAAINLWDSNAKAGIPSQGLMQVIPPTFAAYAGPFLGRGILDPLANIFAGLNYAKHVYPSLQYAMDKPGGYDSGGILGPGLQMVYNGTGRPERVLDASQTEIFDRVMSGASGGSQMLEGNLYLDSGEFLGVVRGQIGAREAQQTVMSRQGVARP